MDRFWKQKDNSFPFCHKIFKQDRVKKGDLPRYMCDINAKAYVVSDKGAIPASRVEPETILVRTFKVASIVTVPILESQRAFFNLNARAKLKAKQAVQTSINMEALKVINAAAAGTGWTTEGVGLALECVCGAIVDIQREGIPAGAILVGERGFMDMTDWNHHDFRRVPAWQSRLPWHTRCIRAYFKNIPVYVSPQFPSNACYVLADRKYFGVTVLEGRPLKTKQLNPAKSRWEYGYIQQIGFAVMNSKAVVRIMHSNPSSFSAASDPVVPAEEVSIPGPDLEASLQEMDLD